MVNGLPKKRSLDEPDSYPRREWEFFDEAGKKLKIRVRKRIR